MSRDRECIVAWLRDMSIDDGRWFNENEKALIRVLARRIEERTDERWADAQGIRILDALNQEHEGWKAVLWVLTKDGYVVKAPEGTPADDPNVVRREQWVVASEQYVYVAGPGGCKLGEFAYGEQVGRVIYTLEDLLPMAHRALAEGGDVHPVLVRMLTTEATE